MISKFRYRKPAQTDAKTGVITGKVGDKTCSSEISEDAKPSGPTNAPVLDDNIMKAFRELFSQLQFSNESALPPDALRKALAESFSDQQRFQLGFMDDAAECFENILLRIHMHIAHGESQDMCNAQHCIPHQKFAMTLVEQTVCGSCGATSEPLSYTQMVHYVSTSTLVYQVRNGNARASPYNHTAFGQLLRKAGNMGDVRMCPSHCGAVIQITRTLMNWPEIVSIGLVWNSERPSLEHIMEVFSTIGTTMLLGDVFTSVMEKKWTENCTHNLVGVVTYYGKHYSTFFFHTKLRVWIYFDDATVRQVGPHWEQVVEKCRKGRYQPLLLLYATPDGTPVNTENAPKQVTQICAQKSSSKKTNPPQNFVRRSVTPSPEKPNIGNTRRAITPNPDCALNQKPPLPKPYSEYQNLSVIQNNLQNGVDVPDGYVGRKEPYVKKLDIEAINKPLVNIHRTLSNGSSSGIEADSMNFPRRRDSGNWSGDRNSASSASSTTMENPYLYLVGKVPHAGVPESPTLVKSDSSSAGSGIYDAGYDSYSLSSNDSSTMTTLQHMMKIGHLANIPEDYNNISAQVTQSCDVLCDEADELLIKSRQLEDEYDLVLALALCNAAATKARAAMNAPYNNPQTLTLARMKHNTCIMRARSLHRRMTQPVPNKESVIPEIRHTREGSSGSGRHSRQNSKDKGQHSRQNSKELLTNLPQVEKPVHKNIEIYATLPKRKDLLKNRIESINIEESLQQTQIEKEPLKETRSFFSRSKQKDSTKREKRSRSEDRSKRVVEFTLTPEIIDIRPKPKEEKAEKQEKEKDGKSKKQHKIRRKLLMGGLIKRKNRSMPDLTDANPEMKSPEIPPKLTVDDSKVGLKENEDKNKSMSGYLSEGHLEFSPNNTNPNLKKSKLMKKSFYASAGKILSVPKVPPPPPLRTTSQLTASKSQLDDEIKDSKNEYQNLYELNNSMRYDTSILERLRFEQIQQRLNDSNNSNSSFNTSTSSYSGQPTTIMTTADVHREPRGSIDHLDSLDQVDCAPPKHLMQQLDLPPYPSPAGSAVHSRQASEDFPPPPPPLDLSALDEHLPRLPPPLSKVPNESLQGQLQNKRDQIFSYELSKPLTESSTVSTSGDTWLKELQAKQAALKVKRIESFNQKNDVGSDVVNTQRLVPKDINAKAASVRDLTSKFEIKKAELCTEILPLKGQPVVVDDSINKSKNPDVEPIAAEQIAEEIREVERINASLQETLNSNKQIAIEERKKTKLGKKKSVSFCDQVILVATAEDQEDDSYIPNPILERVLRSAINKPENHEVEAKDDAQSEDHKTSSENLFDITMRNTMENSKIANPNLITQITAQDQQKVVAPIQYQSTYSSVAFAHNKNTASSGSPHSNGMPMNQYSQYPQNVVQQPQNGNQSYDSYGPSYQENSSNILPHNYISQNPPCLPQQQSYQSQSMYSGNPQYNHHSIYNTRNEPFDQIPHQQQLSQAYYKQQLNQQQLQIHQQPQVHQPLQIHQQPQIHLQSQVPQQSQIHQQPQVHQQPSIHQQPQIPQQTQIHQQSQPIHLQQQAHLSNYSLQNANQTPSYLPASAHYNNAYSQKSYAISSTASNVSSNSYPSQNIYPASSQAVQNNQQMSYGVEGISRQSPNMLQQNYAGQHSRPAYQHPPQPQKNQLSRTSNGVYQSVPYSNKPGPNPVYQRVPSNDYTLNQNPAYQRLTTRTYGDQEQQKMYDPYQRVPSPHGDRDTYNQIPQKTYSVVRNFDANVDPLMPKAVVTPILVNNANNSIPDKTKCNLCRKKVVALSNLYCADCEYYMSRFKPKA